MSTRDSQTVNMRVSLSILLLMFAPRCKLLDRHAPLPAEVFTSVRDAGRSNFFHKALALVFAKFIAVSRVPLMKIEL